jgi:peptidoglycan/xylan/chitin deacetylase (PgdA/CDA1 family)
MAALGNESRDSISPRTTMRWTRILARTISELSALGSRRVWRRPGLRILLYHSVGSTVAHDSYGISISAALFERHMAVLAASQGVSIVDIDPKQLSGLNLRVAVSFDDGYKDNLYVAAPILLKHRIPFTVFATTSFIRQNSKDYLSHSELRGLSSLPGVTIGSHGATHIRLLDCDDGALWEELHGSRRYLEDVIGAPVTAIAYPHGSVNLRVADMARRAGYTLGVCSRCDINSENRNPLLLCRSEVLAQDSERIFLQKLQGAWDWYRWRRRDPARPQSVAAHGFYC